MRSSRPTEREIRVQSVSSGSTATSVRSCRPAEQEIRVQSVSIGSTAASVRSCRPAKQEIRVQFVSTGSSGWNLSPICVNSSVSSVCIQALPVTQIWLQFFWQMSLPRGKYGLYVQNGGAVRLPAANPFLSLPAHWNPFMNLWSPKSHIVFSRNSLSCHPCTVSEIIFIERDSSTSFWSMSVSSWDHIRALNRPLNCFRLLLVPQYLVQWVLRPCERWSNPLRDLILLWVKGPM